MDIWRIKADLEADYKFGYIIINEYGGLIGRIQRNSSEILIQSSLDLPQRKQKGGASCKRFAKIRKDKKQKYLSTISDQSLSFFITDDEPSIFGIFLAGNTNFKRELYLSDVFHSKLKSIVLNIFDTSDGGEKGFIQAIELSKEIRLNPNTPKERKIINKFFEGLYENPRKHCYGILDTVKELTMGAIKTIILFQGLEHIRIKLRNPITNIEKIIIFIQTKENDKDHFFENGIELEILEKSLLAEWIINNSLSFGADLEFITDKSQEGMQFIRGFGGIGGLLHYELEKLQFEENNTLDDVYNF